jgi:hypothetical protein
VLAGQRRGAIRRHEPVPVVAQEREAEECEDSRHGQRGRAALLEGGMAREVPHHHEEEGRHQQAALMFELEAPPSDRVRIADPPQRQGRDPERQQAHQPRGEGVQTRAVAPRDRVDREAERETGIVIDAWTAIGSRPMPFLRPASAWA